VAGISAIQGMGAKPLVSQNRENRPGEANNMWEAKFLSDELNISA